MPTIHFENLSFSDLKDVPRNKSLVFIPVAPHSKDAKTNLYFCEKVSKDLGEKHKDWSFILFPTVYSNAETPPAALRSLLFSYCKKLSSENFKNIVFVGALGGPKQTVVLDEVAAKARWRHRARVISATARLWKNKKNVSTVDNQTIDVLWEEIKPLMERFMNGEKVDKYFKSVFYYVPFHRTDFKWIGFLALYLFAFGIALRLLGRTLMEFNK